MAQFPLVVLIIFALAEQASGRQIGRLLHGHRPVRLRSSTANKSLLPSPAYKYNFSVPDANSLWGRGQKLRELTADERARDADSKRHSPLAPVFYFHIPKTGSTFVNTILSVLCGYEGPAILPYTRQLKRACPQHWDSVVIRLEQAHKPIAVDHHRIYARRFVGTFRETLSRVASGFSDHYHDCRGPISALHGKYSSDMVVKKEAVLAYAACVRECSARMLVGRDCGYRMTNRGKVKDADMTSAEIEQAVAAVGNFGFVALTGRYRESVELFHAIYGGEAAAFELKNTRPSNKRIEGDALKILKEAGWKDEADDRIYAAASEWFEGAQRRFG